MFCSHKNCSWWGMGRDDGWILERDSRGQEEGGKGRAEWVVG